MSKKKRAVFERELAKTGRKMDSLMGHLLANNLELIKVLGELKQRSLPNRSFTNNADYDVLWQNALKLATLPDVPEEEVVG
jgi:hypothetical protein